MTPKKIIAISGSTRTNSTNEGILRLLAKLYQDTLDVELYDGLAGLPHFNPDDDNENVAASVKNFREQIAQADGVIICTPEYVFSLPGALKNAIEWTVSTTVFSDKPVALIVASGLGEKTFESLTLIMNTVGAKIGEHAKLLIQGARSKIHKDGNMDEQTLIALKKLMQSFTGTF
jgi:NAD(P)H-dependent FMN reductase